MAQGRRLVEGLDGSGFPVVAALWLYTTEWGEWRLVIASPVVKDRGQLEAYTAIQKVLRQQHIEMPLDLVAAVAPDDPLVVDLRAFAATAPAPFLGDNPLQRTVIRGQYLEGAHVYRAARLVESSGALDATCATRDRARKVWQARRCRLVMEGGLCQGIEAEGYEWPQKRGGEGVTAHVDLVSHAEERDGMAFGDVQRWTFQRGRLRGIAMIARDVPIEGYSGATPPLASRSA